MDIANEKKKKTFRKLSTPFIHFKRQILGIYLCSAHKLLRSAQNGGVIYFKLSAFISNLEAIFYSQTHTQKKHRRLHFILHNVQAAAKVLWIEFDKWNSPCTRSIEFIAMFLMFDRKLYHLHFYLVLKCKQILWK